MKFTLTIDSDNDACQTRDDLEALLNKVFSNIHFVLDCEEMHIHDANGNRVGEYCLEIDDDDFCSDCSEDMPDCKCD